MAFKICCDAGHNWSGVDTGASGNGLREQDITFFIANKLAKRLREYGIEVIETRPTLETNLGYDLNSSLQARCDIANKAKADYFISIHTNSASNSSANGTETLVYALGGKAEQLAKSIQTNLVNTLKTSDRGVKVQNVKVLRSTNMPAVLIETAFISNPNDANILANRQGDIIEAITKGICEFLGINYKSQQVDYIPSIEDCTQEFLWKGIISNNDYWNWKAYADSNIAWLLKKAYIYIMKNGGSVKNPTGRDFNYCLNVLNHWGIISNVDLWRQKANQDTDVFWLITKIADFIG
jgi:N-acetylmuramoyl-L-alanine amidase